VAFHSSVSTDGRFGFDYGSSIAQKTIISSATSELFKDQKKGAFIGRCWLFAVEKEARP